MDILRFTTAGSIDDGKSTLIGRLLYDMNHVKKDVLDSIGQNGQSINLAHLTDGLRTERQQGITVDVCYKYLTTETRKYIISDAPGHFQFTGNLVSGASLVDAMIILTDAARSITAQTKRHLLTASFLRIKNIVVAVNKMDLVEYSERRFTQVKQECLELSSDVGLRHVTFIPTSGLMGDNVATGSEYMTWYAGPFLLEFIESCTTSVTRSPDGLRCAIQCTVESKELGMLYAGSVLSGSIFSGMKAFAFPDIQEITVEKLYKNCREVSEASAGDHICMSLSGHSVKRGDLICHAANPLTAKTLEADICWLSANRLQKNQPYLLQINSATTVCRIKEIIYVRDIDNFAKDYSRTEMSIHEFGRVTLQTDHAICYELFEILPRVGRAVLVDMKTNDTCAALIIGQEIQPSTN